MNKYHNTRTMVDGILFDSKKEADRYLELKMLQKAKVISDLERQPRFTLQEAFVCDGNRYQKLEYVADFKYQENGETIIEDIKGVKTEVYKIKKKLFLKQYGDKYIFRET